MRILYAVAVLAALLPLTAPAQVPDTVELGQRVRVRVEATRGSVNLFVGNVTALSHDTLTLAIPGGKGTIILPRASISEVAVADGHESRWTNVPRILPALPLVVILAALPTPHGPHSQSLRTQKYALIGMHGLMIGHALMRATPERFRPLYSWLDRP